MMNISLTDFVLYLFSALCIGFVFGVNTLSRLWNRKK